MKQWTVSAGRFQVAIWSQDDVAFNCRLYVNSGDTATETKSKRASIKSAIRWAQQKISEVSGLKNLSFEVA